MMCTSWHTTQINHRHFYFSKVGFQGWNPTCWNYNYFAHIPKHHIDLNSLIDLLEFKGNKLLKNIKTQWILVLRCKGIFFKYKLLVVKMVENNGHIENAKANYELLCDIEMLLGLTCILPCLKTIQGLSKFAQEKDTIICDFIYALKLAKVDFVTMYCNNEKNTTLNISFCSLNLLRTLMMFCVWPSGNNMLLKLITQLYLWEVSFTCYILLIQQLMSRAWLTKRIGFKL